MKKMHKIAILCAGLATLAPAAHAQTVDFTDYFANNVALAQSATYGPITASAWVYSSGSYWTTTDGTASGTPVTLWGRDQTNDNGLGVCSEGEGSPDPYVKGCSNGGGDINELGNNANNELIRLDAGGLVWTDLWVSSLDTGGGSDAKESGIVYFSDAPEADLSTLTAYAFDTTNITGVEGSIWSFINPTAADAQMRYVFFTADGSNDTNNDYLVWKATVVPIPAAAWLFGSALLGIVGVARRKAAQNA